jgi:hypothetical protein
MNHSVRKHTRRDLIADLFCDKPYCFSRHQKGGKRQALPMPQFWEETAKSKFSISPLGIEVDCVRTWECFVLNSIPIVEHSYLDPLYEDLPILLIHNWEDINQNFLEKKYEEIKSKNFSIDKAYMDYWIDLIHQRKKQIQSNDLSFSYIEANNFSDRDLQIFKEIFKKANNINLLIYQGNLTYLRPFQISKEINIPIYLNDFLDLTHLRHSLLENISILDDFKHDRERTWRKPSSLDVG